MPSAVCVVLQPQAVFSVVTMCDWLFLLSDFSESLYNKPLHSSELFSVIFTEIIAQLSG